MKVTVELDVDTVVQAAIKESVEMLDRLMLDFKDCDDEVSKTNLKDCRKYRRALIETHNYFSASDEHI